MNLVGGFYVLFWMLIWLTALKVVVLTWRGSAFSQALGTITA